MTGWRGPTASYGGDECPLCHTQIAKGHPIARWHDRWAHKACVARRYGE